MIAGIINQEPVLRRNRFYRLGAISGTIGIASAYRASWVFQQTVLPSHWLPDSWGFEVKTLRHPKKAGRSLKAARVPLFCYKILWEPPARPRDGEGPERGHHRPVDNRRPAGPYRGLIGRGW